MSDMNSFLREHAERLFPKMFAAPEAFADHFFAAPYASADEEMVIRFYEDISPDAALGDEWLKNNTSYIWRVGALVCYDADKVDYAHVFFGQQRDPDAQFEFIGYLHWQDGENDDIGRCLDRYLDCIRQSPHPVFKFNW